MKSKITKGNGFRGALDYLRGPGEENHPGRAVTVVGAGNVLGSDPRELARQFAASRRLRPEIKNPVFHVSLSCPPGEKLGDEKWAEIAPDYLSRMGLDPDRHQWHCLRHTDQAHDHIHLLVSRIALDGKVWHDQYGIRQSIRICQELEKAHNLKLTVGEEGGERKGLSKGEVGRFRRTGKVPDRRSLQKKIEVAQKNCPDFSTFVAQCEKSGVVVIPNGKSGQIGGVSFRMNGGDPFSGSSLGKAYTWQRIAENTKYNHEKDAGLISRLRAATANDFAGSFRPPAPQPQPKPHLAPDEASALSSAIAEALADNPDLMTFYSRLQVAGIDVYLAIPDGADDPRGIAFRPPGGRHFFRGGDLVNPAGEEGGWRWRTIAAAIKYDRDRDCEAVTTIQRKVVEAEQQKRGAPKHILPTQPADRRPDKIVLPEAISKALEGEPDFATFVSRLQVSGIEIGLSIPEGGVDPQGIAFRRPGGRWTRGGDVENPGGGDFRWKTIADTVKYAPDRDREVVERLNQQIVQPHRDPRKEREQTFTRKDSGEWVWTKRPERVAFAEMPDHVRVYSRQELAIRAALLTSADLYGPAVEIAGSDEFRRRAWLIGSQMGLEIIGYQPTDSDLAELAVWREKHGGPAADGHASDSIGPAQQNEIEIQPGYTLPEEETEHEYDSEHGRRDRVPDGSGISGGSRTAKAAPATSVSASGAGRGDTAIPAADSGAGGRDLAAVAGPAGAGRPGDRDADRTLAAATREGDGSRDGDPQSHGVPVRSGGGVAERDSRVQSGSRGDDSLREGRAAGGREIHAAGGDADGTGRGQRAGSNTPRSVTDSDGTQVLRHVPPRDVADLSDFGRHFQAYLAAEQAGPDDAQGGGDVSRDLVKNDQPGKTPDRENHRPAEPEPTGPDTASEKKVETKLTKKQKAPSESM